VIRESHLPLVDSALARPPESQHERRQGFRDPAILIAFGLATLIWSSTWIVIKDQLGPDPATAVPPAWSVTYRFVLASVTMFALALVRRNPLALDRRTHLFAALLGLLQFFINYNSVYAAELYVTSGLVAVVFALLPAPNALLAFLCFGRRTSRAFMAGSVLAFFGVAMLFLQEIRVSAAPPEAVALGIFFALVAVLGASAANVMQLSEALRERPIVPLLAWAMLYGALLDAAYALAFAGPPVVESRIGYWIGLLYLGIVASAVAFALYYRVIRAVGPAQAAYSSVLIPILAMAISTAVENYRWSALAAGGGVLALAGMAVALRAGRAPAPLLPPTD